MRAHRPSRISRIAVLIALVVGSLLPVATADAREAVVKQELTHVVQQRAEAKPKCATGTLTPSGTHCYLPAVITR